MATLRDIKRRIVGIENTKKITRAMKMVASAKLRKAQDAIINARPYAKKMSYFLENLLVEDDLTTNSLFIEKEVKDVLLVVVTSDKGLCGSFNSIIIREANRLIDLYNSEGIKPLLLCLGKKGYDFFGKQRNTPKNIARYEIYSGEAGLFSKINNETANRIAHQIINDYKSEKFQRVVVLYNEFKSLIQQKLISEQYLPIKISSSEAGNDNSRFIYEPNNRAIFNSLLPKYLNSYILRVLLESNAAEQAAKMTAMENATNNAQDLITTLKITYNKARQASITKELIEVVSGANALKS